MRARTRARIPGRHVIVASLVVAGLIGSACSGDDDTAGTTTIAPTTTTGDTVSTELSGPAFVFGYVRPATGLLSQLAIAQEDALQLAVDDINAAGGVNGGQATIVSADEPADGDVGAAVDSLLDQGASIILGPTGSTEAVQVLPELAAKKTIACSASATSSSLSSLDPDGVFFRTAMNDAYTVTYVADTLTELAAEQPADDPFTVAILARTDDYGIGVSTGLASVLLSRDITSTIVGYNPRRVIFTEEANKVAALQPDVVLLVSYGEAVRQIDSLVDAGVPASTIIGLDGLMNPRLAPQSFPDDPMRIDGLRVIGATGDRAFLQRLADVRPQPQFVFGAQMYDCAITAALAASAAASVSPVGFGPQLAAVTSEGRVCSTYADCVDKLGAGEDIDYNGVSGGIRFDENGDASEVRFTTAGFEQGELTEISSTDFSVDDLKQQEAIAGAIFVARLQQLLTALGYYSGPIDGQYSSEVVAAVGALQSDLGVPVTGIYDAETDAAVRAKYGDVLGSLGQSVISIQILLTQLGYYTGPIDGVYSPATVAAIRALQRDLGVPETGIIDAATMKAAYEQGIIAGTPPTTTLPPATTVPPTTVPPTTTLSPATTVPPETTLPPTTTVPPAPPTTIEPVDPEAPTILEALRADDRFTTLVEVLTAAGYTDDVAVIGPLTFFAPTNDAFADIPPADLEAIVANPELLQAILAFHLVEGKATLEALATLTQVETVFGELIDITVDPDGTVLLNGVRTIAPEIDARNGVVIAIESVLQPKANPLLR